jgi:hypothetical protein
MSCSHGWALNKAHCPPLKRRLLICCLCKGLNNTNISQIHVRQAGDVPKLLPQFARRKFSFAVRAVEQWNRLPDEMKLAANKEEFRAKGKRLKK